VIERTETDGTDQRQIEKDQQPTEKRPPPDHAEQFTLAPRTSQFLLTLLDGVPWGRLATIDGTVRIQSPAEFESRRGGGVESTPRGELRGLKRRVADNKCEVRTGNQPSIPRSRLTWTGRGPRETQSQSHFPTRFPRRFPRLPCLEVSGRTLGLDWVGSAIRRMFTSKVRRVDFGECRPPI